MGLRLLHVSDIHFGGYGPAWDDDEDQRREVIASVKRYANDVGPIDAILVGGDVAYSGAPHEYEAARRWLHDLATDAQCNPARIWTVPGNHDIDQASLKSSVMGQEFREALRQCDVASVDTELRDRLSREPNAGGLLTPLANYNSFALEWECGITAESPMWRDNSLSVDGLAINLTGVCSALVSDWTDAEGEDSKRLVVGTRQCQIPSRGDHVSIVMCHHPPGWIRDWTVIEPYLETRAHLVLFGHEHRYNIRKSDDGPVYISAGAIGPPHVGPFVDEDYAPTFNVVELSVNAGQLSVTVHPRRWSSSAATFEALSSEHFTMVLSSESVQPRPVSEACCDAPVAGSAPERAPLQSSPLVSTNSELGDDAVVDEPGRSPVELRELGLAFVRLPRTTQIALLTRLGVVSDDDLALPEPLFISEALTRVREAHLIERLAEELSRDL